MPEPDVDDLADVPSLDKRESVAAILKMARARHPDASEREAELLDLLCRALTGLKPDFVSLSTGRPFADTVNEYVEATYGLRFGIRRATKPPRRTR